MSDPANTGLNPYPNLDPNSQEVPLYGNPNPNLYQNNAYVYGNNPYPSGGAYGNPGTTNPQMNRPPTEGFSGIQYPNQPRSNSGYVPPMGYGQPQAIIVVENEPRRNVNPDSNEYKAEVLAEKIRYGYPCFLWGNYCWMFFSIFFFFFEDVKYIVSLLFAIACNILGIVAASVGTDALRKCSKKKLDIFFRLIAIYFASLLGRCIYLIFESGISGVFVFTYNGLLPMVLWAMAFDIKKTMEQRQVYLAAARS